MVDFQQKKKLEYRHLESKWFLEVIIPQIVTAVKNFSFVPQKIFSIKIAFVTI